MAVLKFDVKAKKTDHRIDSEKAHWTFIGSVVINTDEMNGSLYLNMFEQKFYLFEKSTRTVRS